MNCNPMANSSCRTDGCVAIGESTNDGQASNPHLQSWMFGYSPIRVWRWDTKNRNTTWINEYRYKHELFSSSRTQTCAPPYKSFVPATRRNLRGAKFKQSAIFGLRCTSTLIGTALP